MISACSISIILQFLTLFVRISLSQQATGKIILLKQEKQYQIRLQCRVSQCTEMKEGMRQPLVCEPLPVGGLLFALKVSHLSPQFVTL